jgi:hypothetical protein
MRGGMERTSPRPLRLYNLQGWSTKLAELARQRRRSQRPGGCGSWGGDLQCAPVRLTDNPMRQRRELHASVEGCPGKWAPDGSEAQARASHAWGG